MQEFQVIKFTDKVNNLVIQAQTFQIINQETFESAAQFRIALKILKKSITDDADPIIKQAYQLHRDLTSKKAKLIEPLDNADKIILSKRGEYTLRLQQEAEAEQKRLQDIADKARAKALAEAQKKIDKLIAKSSGDAEILKSLEDALTNPECLLDDAEMLRRQISILQVKIANTQQKASEIEAQAQNSAIPEIITVDNAPEGGKIKFDRVIEFIYNPTSAVKWLSENHPECLKIDDGEVKKLLNREETLLIPGIKIGKIARERVKV
jgi:regulator of protease activity HflC (stomatin/prohibitin superfamily)